MSIEHILFLIDEEINRLKEAHAVLSETLVPTKRLRRQQQKKSALPPVPVAVTVLPARVPRQRTVRPKPVSVASHTALSHAAPGGVVAVSAINAARDRARTTTTTPPERPPRWLPVRAKQAMTIDDLFGDSGRAGTAE